MFDTATDAGATGNSVIGNCSTAVGNGALLLNKNNVFQRPRNDLWLLERIVAADLRDARMRLQLIACAMPAQPSRVSAHAQPKVLKSTSSAA
jgi:hypothetical protein